MRDLVLSLTLHSTQFTRTQKKLYDLRCLTFDLELDLALGPALDLALTRGGGVSRVISKNSRNLKIVMTIQNGRLCQNSPLLLCSKEFWHR